VAVVTKSIVGCHAVQSGRSPHRFRTNILPLSSGSNSNRSDGIITFF
jgi:hypothetical protein